MPRYVVRCGSMRTLGVHTTARGEVFRRGERVIARTDRGQEVGEILCEATEQALEHLKDPPKGQILRRMTEADEEENVRGRGLIRKAFDACKRLALELQLDMEPIDVEQLFGGERLVFYYLSENRVDFRELVKRLQQEFGTRIEMRQVGVRDEARLLADYGDCGKPVCCNTHLSVMPPVSMKMAKLQRATLDPSKISGRCGRLKCCLRYEYDTYVALQKELPAVGSTVLTRNGRFKVLAQEILAAQLLVEAEDRRRLVVPAADVLTVLAPPSKRGAPRPEDDEGDVPAPSSAPSAPSPNSGRPQSGRPQTPRPQGGNPPGGSPAHRPAAGREAPARPAGETARPEGQPPGNAAERRRDRRKNRRPAGQEGDAAPPQALGSEAPPPTAEPSGPESTAEG